MTKDYALAGLRLGYAISAEPIISVLKRVRPPWNISAPAQKAGIIALKADDYLKECGLKIGEAQEFLIRELKSLGLSPLPSPTSSSLLHVGNAAEFRHALLKRGLLIRDCASFGLADYIRLAPRTLAECQRLITAIKEIAEQPHPSKRICYRDFVPLAPSVTTCFKEGLRLLREASYSEEVRKRSFRWVKLL